MLRIIMPALLLLLPPGLLVVPGGEEDPLHRDVSPYQADSVMSGQGVSGKG